MNKTPKLRFKEFSGDWEHKHLDKIIERVTRKNKGTLSKLPLTISAQHGLVDQETFFNKTVASKNLEGYYLLENGEFAYNKSYSNGYPWGAIKRLDRYEKGVLSSLYICFKTLDKANSDYIKHYFETSKWYKEVSMIAVEGARNHGLLNISVSDFFNTLHYIPSKEEQEKIASFISLIDDKISLQGEKVEILKDYKKGMMQKIFSRELRFKDDDGRDYLEWEEIELNEMLALTIDNRGKTPPLTQKGTPLLEVNSLGAMYPDFNKINKFVDEETYNDWFRNHIKEGDLLFTTVGATGLVSLADSTKSCIAQNIVGFRFEEGYNSKFMYNLFNYRETIKRIKAIEMGAVQPSVKVTQLIKLKFLIPSLKEQIKIGSTLSNIDKKIAKEQEKLDYLSEYKKGLLQQMFV